jgi:hypothetical protein
MDQITNYKKSLMKQFLKLSLCIGCTAFCLNQSIAQNPLIQDQFTADPSARVFGDSVYVYPSHDIVPPEGKGRPEWFNMGDYHVFSSGDLNQWTDHGVIVSQENVPWVNPESYSMWAPDAIERNGKYYFYFPSIPKDTLDGRGFKIGVAVADAPEGPYTPEPEPIKNVKGIDPNVFIDDDGQAYLYWSARHIFGARLSENMLEIESPPETLKDLPEQGLKEGPYMFKHNGLYYLTYPHVEHKTERLEYAISDHPLGPFEQKGVIMDESPTGCWTNHHSIIAFKGQHYLFYHHNDLSPEFDKNRSIRADSLFFQTDGSIKKVIPSLRGVGITPATEKIDLDRFSKKSDGASIGFMDPEDPFKGWFISLKEQQWLRYDKIDFNSGLKNAILMNKSAAGAVLELRLDERNGPLLMQIKLSGGKGWSAENELVKSVVSGTHDLFVICKSGSVMIDWIRFGNAKKE